MTDRHTILVLDDEPDVVSSVRDLLRREYNVLGATRTSEAMKLLGEHVVHVIMTDQRMPGMTGVEFLRTVRCDHPDAIRLLFTGYADIRTVIDAINQGSVYRYITKPWDPEELQLIIREACERYELIVQRKHLLSELTRKNEELERVNASLAQANELKTAFIRVASHELRTPLTVLLTLTWMAERAQDVPPGWKDRLRQIDTSAKRLQRVVDQLTTMLWAGQFIRTLERQTVDLPTLLKEAAEDVRPFVFLRHQKLELDVPADLGTALVEPAKIRDALNHVLLNAIKFSPDGGLITLSASRAKDGAAHIRVSDRGIGIASASLPRIFEPFFTGFDVSSHASGVFEFGARGLGLGLSVVKAFVEMHGGQVAVESELGRGTTITITLPPDLGAGH